MDAHGRVRDPATGKFVPKTADAAPAAPAATAAPAAPQPPAAPPDPVNDPIPEGAKPATRERIGQLVEMVKTKDTELATTRGDLELLTSHIQDAGATVEQFQEAMQLLKFINSPHQHEQLQALQYLQGAGATLAERLGVVPPGADPLAGNPDLIQAVQANPALRPLLEETARSRRLVAATQQHQQTSLQRSQQQQAQQREVQEGQNAVRAVEQGFEAVDPQYKAKIEILRSDATFVNALRGLPPKQWAAKFAEKYRSIKIAAPPPPKPPAALAAPAGHSPLRAKTPAGTAAKPPGSMLEAVKGALGEPRAH